MADGVETIPTGQPYGERAQQERFVAATQPAPEAPIAAANEPSVPQHTYQPPQSERVNDNPNDVVTQGVELAPDEFGALLEGSPAASVPPDDEDLRDWVPVIAEIARQPGASPAMRALYAGLRNIFGSD